MKTRRLTKKEMWIFAIGQLGWSTLSGIITAWLVSFYLPTYEKNADGSLIFTGTGIAQGENLPPIGGLDFYTLITPG